MPAPPRLSRLHLALLVLLGVAVYANTLGNEFHLDDHYRIVGNPELEQVWPPWRHFADPSTSSTLRSIEQYRPLLPLSLSVDFAISDALGADRRAGLHVGNALVHVLSSVLVYLLLRELLGGRGGAERAIGRGPAAAERAARFASALFAVHPVGGIPVNYLCARDLLLMELFLLAGLTVYARMRRRGDSALGWAAVLGLFSLSILAKTNAIVAPGLVLAYELLLGSRRLRGTAWRVVLSAAPAVGFLALTELVLDFSDYDQLRIERSSAWEYPLTQLRLHLVHYARNLVWPFELRPLPAVEPAHGLLEPGVLAGLAFVVATLAVAWRLRLRAPAVSFCILAYWILMSLTSSVIPMRRLATDYRQYASLPFAFAAVGVALFAVRGGGAGGAVRRVVAAAVVAAAAVVSIGFANPLWRDGLSLWGQSVRYGGEFRAHQNYAASLFGVDPERAEEHYRIALEASPGDVWSQSGLGWLLVNEGREEEGLALMERSVEGAPEVAALHHWMARGYEEVGRLDDAARESSLAHQLDPRSETYRAFALHHHRAAAWPHYYAGRYGRALAHVEAAGRIEPATGEFLFLEGYVRSKTGDLEGAVGCFERYLEEDPEHASVLLNLGYVLVQLGRHGEAVAPLLRCLAIDPESAEAHAYLAQAFEGLGDATQAAFHRREAARLEEAGETGDAGG